VSVWKKFWLIRAVEEGREDRACADPLEVKEFQEWTFLIRTVGDGPMSCKLCIMPSGNREFHEWPF
jgi:hypothetical protein